LGWGQGKDIRNRLTAVNEHGTDVITLRHIARKMSISHSNIQYYFKNADDIIATIYSNHLKELNKEVSFPDDHQYSLFDMLRSVEIIFAHIYQYRFIYTDPISFARRIPQVRNNHNERYRFRSKQLVNISDHLREKVIFRKDIPTPVWESLIKQIYTIGDFWISANEFINEHKGETVIRAFTNLVQNMLYPYLTAKGVTTEITFSYHNIK